jgi:arylformamidase
MTSTIFLGYDRAALDREYDNRRKVLDAPAWLTRFAEASGEARADIPCRLDVAYGVHPTERLDIFPAERATPAPIHVFIHGGYWQWLDKKDFSYVARAFVPAGITTVVINYALIPTVTMAEIVRQCRAAIACSGVIRSGSRSPGTPPAAISSRCSWRRSGRRSGSRRTP